MKSRSKHSLTKKQITALLHAYDRWTLSPKGSSLSATFLFKEHLDALVFIARLTVHAQVLNHHPDILFTYKKVKITLTTHDAKCLTKIDSEFLKRIEEIVYKSH